MARTFNAMCYAASERLKAYTRRANRSPGTIYPATRLINPTSPDAAKALPQNRAHPPWQHQGFVVAPRQPMFPLVIWIPVRVWAPPRAGLSNTQEKLTEEAAQTRVRSIAGHLHRTCLQRLQAARRCPARSNTGRIASVGEDARFVRDPRRVETQDGSAE